MRLKAQAMVEMQSIETAIKSYLNEYGKLPVEAGDQGASDPEADETFSRGIINILTGVNARNSNIGPDNINIPTMP